jgi:hypothetical protein
MSHHFSKSKCSKSQDSKLTVLLETTSMISSGPQLNKSKAYISWAIVRTLVALSGTRLHNFIPKAPAKRPGIT